MEFQSAYSPSSFWLLGNGTMEKLKQLFASSSQMYGALTLDLHCNRFGPTTLFQVHYWAQS